MAKTISELRNQSLQVRDASATGENTATRVGTVLNDIVGHIEDYENTQSSKNTSQDTSIEAVKNSLNVEVARAKSAESNLSTLIGNERTDRQSAISREETARIQADALEKSERQSADNKEQDARIQADNAEKTARENADITLRTMIQTETSDRKTAIQNETARAKAAEEANAAAIENVANELSDHKDLSNSRYEHVTDEINRLDISDEANAKAIADETTRAKAAEQANATAIADETARAKAAEEANTTAIADETARAKAAEESNTQAIAERGIYDVSAYNGGAVFESLSALLNNANLSTLIPASVRCGGMSIRFIQGSVPNSDNKYVQFRLMAASWSTTVSDWQGIDDKPTAGSNNLVKSGGVNSDLNNLEVTISSAEEKVNNASITKENGFFVTDQTGNIVVSVSSKGKFDVFGLGENILEIIRHNVLSGNYIETQEDGFYFIDQSYNVGVKIGIDGKISSYSGDNNNDYVKVLKRLNDSTKLCRELKNQLDTSIPALLPIESTSQHENFTVTLPSVGARKKAMVKVGLHYGSQDGTPKVNEVFFGGSSKKDFSDVRFFDQNGNILKAQFGEAVNMEPIWDSKLNNTVKVLSDGTLVGYNNGVVLSTDKGETWTPIAGTTDATTHVSAGYRRAYMYPVFVDSNDNIYAYRGGILYKLSASDNYATISSVLDFSWVDNDTTIYPDIQNHAMDEDINGNLFVGACYQVQYHTTIFVSTDGGETFSISWASWQGSTAAEYSEHAQHCHHIHADKYTSDVYVGVDDGSIFWNGSIVLKTSNGGQTWTDISATNHAQRGRDYYPTYFGESGYKLGGGEVYTLGGNAIIRSFDDEVYQSTMYGVGGVRSFGDFGNEDLIVAGIQRNDNVSSIQIVYSKDKGKTWKPFFYQDTQPAVHSGAGFRDALSVQINGDSERCVLFCISTNTDAMRLYHGGQHYYREAYILLEDIADTDIVITAKTGYAIPYPFDCLQGDILTPNYELPLQEGYGNIISDSEGRIAQILGGHSWEDEPVRSGDYWGSNIRKYFNFFSALKISGKAVLGKIDSMPINKNYTVCFWLNEKARRLYNVPEDRWSNCNDDITFKLMGFAGLELYRINGSIGLMLPGYDSAFKSHRASINVPQYLMFSDNYTFVALVVKENAIEVSLNGNTLLTKMNVNTLTELNAHKLSEKEFYLGSDSNMPDGYIGDVCFYDKALSTEDINAIYKGYYNYKLI